MDQNSCIAPDAPNAIQRVRSSERLTVGDLCELILLGVYVAVDAWILLRLSSVDWPELWRRYGDTDAYWGTVFSHMRECQLMIVQPIGLLILWPMCVAVFRGRLRWTSVLAALTILGVELFNFWCCYYDAFGVGC
jgi:hypothetical protein